MKNVSKKTFLRLCIKALKGTHSAGFNHGKSTSRVDPILSGFTD